MHPRQFLFLGVIFGFGYCCDIVSFTNGIYVDTMRGLHGEGRSVAHAAFMLTSAGAAC